MRDSNLATVEFDFVQLTPPSLPRFLIDFKPVTFYVNVVFRYHSRTGKSPCHPSIHCQHSLYGAQIAREKGKYRTTMVWSRIATINTKCLRQQATRSRLVWAKTQTSRGTATLSSGSDSSNNWSSWSFAVASVALLSGGAVSFTLCDSDAKSQKPHREFRYDGIRDPMTTYAMYAKEREKREKEAARQETKHIAKESEVQATSSANASHSPQEDEIDSDLTPSEARIEEEARKAKKHAGGLKVFSGNGNMALSLEIARHLGINLGKATVGRFADGEVNCVIHENVRGKDVYIVQPTCPPVNDNIMELLLMVSTLRRASARRITVVIPYYGYARQDRKMQVILDIPSFVFVTIKCQPETFPSFPNE